jgi:hypothetical protein
MDFEEAAEFMLSPDRVLLERAMAARGDERKAK